MPDASGGRSGGAEPVGGEGSATAREPRGRILVIEPDAGVGDAIAAWLERAGYRVLGARDADAALAGLSDGPSLLLCEIPVPGRETLEFLRDLRASQPELPTILMTTGAREGLCQEARRLGFSTWLIKPFLAEELETMVGWLLGRDRLTDPKGLGKRREPRFPVFLPVTCRPWGGGRFREHPGTLAPGAPW